VDAPDHGSVTGMAEGRPEQGSDVGATKLALTLSTRDQFLGLPLLVVAAGIVLSMLVAVAGALWLPIVARNRLARVRARGRNITGLAARSEALLTAGRSADEVARILAPVVRHGPGRATAARASLRKALDDGPLPTKPRYGAAARNEADRSDNKIDDFLADGSPVDHPAHRFEVGLQPMRAYYDQLAIAKKEIDEKLRPACQQGPRVSFEVAELAWSRVENPDGIAELEEKFDDARTVLDQKLAPSAQCLKPGVTSASAEEVRVKIGPIDVTLPAGELLGAVGRWGVFIALGLATIVAIAAAVLLAGLGVWLTTYEPVATFGESKDYAALGIAALGTGVIANVVAILQPWTTGGG
jgi:hypothetical protein